MDGITPAAWAARAAYGFESDEPGAGEPGSPSGVLPLHAAGAEYFERLRPARQSVYSPADWSEVGANENGLSEGGRTSANASPSTPLGGAPLGTPSASGAEVQMSYAVNDF